MYASMIPNKSRVFQGDTVIFKLIIANNEGHSVTVDVDATAPDSDVSVRTTTTAVVGTVTGNGSDAGAIDDTLVMAANSKATYTITEVIEADAPVGTRLFPPVKLGWNSLHPSCQVNLAQVPTMELLIEPAPVENLPSFFNVGDCNCN